MGLTTHANQSSADPLTPAKQFRHFIRIVNDATAHGKLLWTSQEPEQNFSFISMEISEIRLGSTQNYIGNVNKLCKGFNALYLLIKFHKDHVSRPVSHPSLVLQPAHIQASRYFNRVLSLREIFSSWEVQFIYMNHFIIINRFKTIRWFIIHKCSLKLCAI